jgi:hypothetical protein
MTSATESSSKKKEICKIAVLVTLFFLSIAFIVSYVVYDGMLNDRLETVTEVSSYLLQLLHY